MSRIERPLRNYDVPCACAWKHTNVRGYIEYRSEVNIFLVGFLDICFVVILIYKLIEVFLNMPRNYKRKTDRGTTASDTMLTAVRAVKIHNLSIRQAAVLFHINCRTLARYCEKIPEKDYARKDITTPTISVGYKNRQIFTDSEEQKLVNYILHASDIYFGLSPKEIRILAYNLASYNSIKMPESWITNGMAGEVWLSGLIKRHNNISIRKPEATSKARATSFNRHNVELFYKNLSTVMSRHHFQLQNIWNMDETRVTTVQVPDRIVTRKGHKQIGSIVSAKCGTLVTMACAVSALGNHIPPFLYFLVYILRIIFLHLLYLEQVVLQTNLVGCKKQISCYF